MVCQSSGEREMGYQLNSLANLPIDADVKFYIFVIDDGWNEPVNKVISDNFSNIARSIGNDAVIAAGLNPTEFHNEVADKYLGKDAGKMRDAVPALLITNSHPDNLDQDSLRLLVPLRFMEERFGGWSAFFQSLTDFVTLNNDDFIHKFQNADNAIDSANKIVIAQPSFFGFGININELVTWYRKRTAHVDLGGE